MLGHSAISETPISALPIVGSVLPSFRRRVLGSRTVHPSMYHGGSGVIRSGGKPPPWVEFSQTYQQGFRIADSAYDLYELYVGEDATVDFDASGQPVQTSSSLPFSWTPTPPGSGSKTLHIVVRKRNAYNLVSLNVYETIKVINALSAEVPGPVSDPYDVAVYDGDLGYVQVMAKYCSTEDGSYPADTWEIYVKEGADPVAGVDTPDYDESMVFLGHESGVSQAIGPFTPGAVVHVLVVAKRSSDSERGEASIELHTLAISLDLDEGLMFGGGMHEQR